MLKGISGNKHRLHFVLYDLDKRDHLLHSIINRLPTDVQRQFIIDEYTDKDGATYPCISRSASGENTDSSTMGAVQYGGSCVWRAVWGNCVGELGGAVCGGLWWGSCVRGAV